MNNNLSYIHPNAKIGANVEISPFVTIHDDVEIGEGTHIYSNVTIFPGARIGRNCKIFPGAVIAAIPQDLKFHGEYTTAEIGDNTTLRECVTVNRGTAAKGKTTIGNNNLIMAYCHIAHDCILGNNIIISNSSQLAGEVTVDDYAVIGGGTLVHQFSHLGSHIMIQGGSHVNKDVPPYVTAAKSPISYVGLNLVGLRRRGFSSEKIEELQEIYRRLFHVSYLFNKIGQPDINKAARFYLYSYKSIIIFVFRITKVIFLITTGTATFQRLELVEKVRYVIIATGIRYLVDIHFIFHKQFTSVADTHLYQKIHKGLAGTLFEITTERTFGKMYNIGHLLHRNIAMIILQNIIIYFTHSRIIRFTAMSRGIPLTCHIVIFL